MVSKFTSRISNGKIRPYPISLTQSSMLSMKAIKTMILLSGPKTGSKPKAATEYLPNFSKKMARLLSMLLSRPLANTQTLFTDRKAST
jgi:hypothetical protein